jgi:hypothetical protein
MTLLAARIDTEAYVTAMVALDTIDAIEARVRRLLSHGRRIALARRYIHLDEPTELYVGLAIDTRARAGGIDSWRDDTGAGFSVQLRPHLIGFWLSVYAGDDNATEEQAWKRYHAHKACSDARSERRRKMTLVEIIGGRANDGPARDDRILIRAWNRDGICDERVIGFDRATP